MLNIVLKTVREHLNLTNREAEVVALMISGKVAMKDIASSLGISKSTVAKYIESILEKSGSESRAELLAVLVHALCVTMPDFIRENCTPNQNSGDEPRLLVIDDCTEISQTLVETLSNTGFDAKELRLDLAAGTKSAFDLHAPEVVVADYVLGKETGIDLLKEIRGDSKVFPSVILFTGYPQKVREKSWDFVQSVLFKPLEIEALLREVWLGVYNYRVRKSIITNLS